MSQTLRQIFEKFLKEFKEGYNIRTLQIISDLQSTISRLYRKDDPFWKGYKKALGDMEKAVRMIK